MIATPIRQKIQAFTVLMVLYHSQCGNRYRTTTGNLQEYDTCNSSSQYDSLLTCLTSCMTYTNEAFYTCDCCNKMCNIGFPFFTVWNMVTSGNCPSGYTFISASKTCVRLFLYQDIYVRANVKCLSEEGELVKIDSPEKQNAIVNFIESHAIPGTVKVLIQGERLPNSTYIFDNLQAMTYFKWCSEHDQPDGGGKEKILRLDSEYNYKWHDVSDDDKGFFICEVAVV